MLNNIPWQQFPERTIVKVRDDLYIVRIGSSVNIPIKHYMYNDVNIKLTQHSTDGNLVLGYSLLVKRIERFEILQKDWWLSLLTNVKEHYNPKIIYKDQQIYLYRFNGRRNPSYWFVLRKA